MRYNIVDYINFDFLGPVHISDIVNSVFLKKKNASASITGALNMPIKQMCEHTNIFFLFKNYIITHSMPSVFI
jgi:hypothetical protein